MATRTTRTFGENKAVYGEELIAMRQEFSKLVDEVEELKNLIGTHTHTGVTAGAAVTGVASTITFTTTDAKKIA